MSVVAWDDDWDEDGWDDYYDDCSNDGGWYYRRSDYRPLITPEEHKQVLDDASARFARELSEANLSLDEALERGRSYVAEQQQESGDYPLVDMGPYVLWLRAWYNVHEEGERNHDMRIASNYLRHNVLSYDSLRQLAYDTWWMPESFPDEMWTAARFAIVVRYPETEDSFRSLAEARKYYDAFRHPSLGNKTDAAVNEEYRKLQNKQSSQESKMYDDMWTMEKYVKQRNSYVQQKEHQYKTTAVKPFSDYLRSIADDEDCVTVNMSDGANPQEHKIVFTGGRWARRTYLKKKKSYKYKTVSLMHIYRVNRDRFADFTMDAPTTNNMKQLREQWYAEWDEQHPEEKKLIDKMKNYEDRW